MQGGFVCCTGTSIKNIIYKGTKLGKSQTLSTRDVVKGVTRRQMNWKPRHRTVPSHFSPFPPKWIPQKICHGRGRSVPHHILCVIVDSLRVAHEEHELPPGAETPVDLRPRHQRPEALRWPGAACAVEVCGRVGGWVCEPSLVVSKKLRPLATPCPNQQRPFRPRKIDEGKKPINPFSAHSKLETICEIFQKA